VPYVFDHLDLIKEALRRSPFGLITDIDGTISKTAPTPQQAEISPLCRQYLSALCNYLALVAAISGRPAVQVRITPLLAMKGISIENKGVTASIHYRLCYDPQSAERHILAAIENSPHARGLRTVHERMAIDLIPPVEVNKGTATLDLIQEYNLQSGVYLGDDLTDVDAFRAVHTACRDLDFQGFAIGITSQEMPDRLTEEVDFTLNGVGDVERFLKWLSQTAVELN